MTSEDKDVDLYDDGIWATDPASDPLKSNPKIAVASIFVTTTISGWLAASDWLIGRRVEMNPCSPKEGAIVDESSAFKGLPTGSGWDLSPVL